MNDSLSTARKEDALSDLPVTLVDYLGLTEGLNPVGPERASPLGRTWLLQKEDEQQNQHLAALLPHSQILLHKPATREVLETIFDARASAETPPEAAPIIASDPYGETPWAVVNLEPGTWLTDQVAKHGRVPIPQAIQIIRHATLAIAGWHNNKLVTGPILPQEVWVPQDGTSVQCPWLGLSRLVLTEGWRETSLGQPLLPFSPPEVLNGGDWDMAADLYSLGCLAYWLLTGEMPFHATTVEELRQQQKTHTPRTPPELRMGVPSALSELVMRLIAVEAHERPLKAQPVADRLAILGNIAGSGPTPSEGYGVRADQKASPAPSAALSAIDEELKRLSGQVEAKPDDPELWVKLGQTQLKFGKPADALASAEKAIKINPRMGSAALLRVDALLAKGEAKRALADLAVIAKALPSAPPVLLRMARALSVDGNHAKAIAACDAVLKCDAKNLDALNLRARAHQAAGQFARALDDLDVAVTLAKVSKSAGLAKLLALRADVNLHLNRFEEAQADLEVALQTDPNNLAARLTRVNYLLAVGKPGEAEADCDYLVNHAGRQAWSWLLRAKQRQLVAEYGPALADLEQALALESTPQSLAQAALLLAAAPDKEIRDGDRALELGRQAADATGWEDPVILEAVAAAYAACGQAQTAAGWILKAITKVKGDDRDRLQETLKLYKAGKPYRLGR